MAIEKRGESLSIRYYNRGVPNPQRFTCPPGTSTGDARDMDAKIRLHVREHGYWEPEELAPTRLDQLVGEYIEARRNDPQRPASAGTLHLYVAVLPPLVRHLRGRGHHSPPLRALSENNVQGFLRKKRDSGVKTSTASTYARTIKAFWRWAHERYPDHVSPPKLKSIRVPVTGQLAATWAQIDSMRSALVTAEWAKRSTLIQRYTGLRQFQVQAITYGDLRADLDGHGPAMQILKGKTEEETARRRWIPVAAPLWAALQAWRLADGVPTDDVPIIGHNIPRNPDETISAAWNRTDVPKERFYRSPTKCMRKRMESFLTEEGVPDPHRRHMLGRYKRGVSERHYIECTAFFPRLREALAHIPDIAESRGTSSSLAAGT